MNTSLSAIAFTVAAACLAQDHDHFSEAWTWNDNGREHTEVFHFTRKT